MTRTAAPRDLFVEMARILAGAAPTLPRMPPGRVVEMQSRSRCGLEEALAEMILQSEQNKGWQPFEAMTQKRGRAESPRWRPAPARKKQDEHQQQTGPLEAR